MSDERFDRLDDKLDKLTETVGDFRVSVEHRLTKAEERAGIFGAVSGIISALGLTWLKGKVGNG